MFHFFAYVIFSRTYSPARNARKYILREKLYVYSSLFCEYVLLALGQLILKKWLLPHRMRSPCFTRVLDVTARPFTQVLKVKVIQQGQHKVNKRSPLGYNKVITRLM